MSLERCKNLLSLLEEQLHQGSPECDPDPLLESVVVNYLLTVAYADAESSIRERIAEYCEDLGSAGRVQAFVGASVRKVVRSIKCAELAGVLGQFDDNCKKHFQEAVNNTPSQAAYDRVIAGRHDQAHSLGSSMTLADLKADVEGCEQILEAFSAALACSCVHD